MGCSPRARRRAANPLSGGLFSPNLFTSGPKVKRSKPLNLLHLLSGIPGLVGEKPWSTARPHIQIFMDGPELPLGSAPGVRRSVPIADVGRLQRPKR